MARGRDATPPTGYRRASHAILSDLPALRRALLDWYDAEARALPWRVGPQDHAAGARADPYRVWLSEVMLQQTTVPHATPYFHAFTTRWPTVADLAGGGRRRGDGGVGGARLLRRARNLLACARAVAGEHAGVFPDTEAGCAPCPALAPYTAAAVAAIAFERPAVAVDGNVERVTARLFDVREPPARRQARPAAAWPACWLRTHGRATGRRRAWTWAP